MQPGLHQGQKVTLVTVAVAQLEDVSEGTCRCLQHPKYLWALRWMALTQGDGKHGQRSRHSAWDQWTALVYKVGHFVFFGFLVLAAMLDCYRVSSTSQTTAFICESPWWADERPSLANAREARVLGSGEDLGTQQSLILASLESGRQRRKP